MLVMTKWTTIKAKINILVLLFVLCADAMMAQQLRNYRGNYTLNSRATGTANYSYYQITDDSIQLHGRFTFTSDAIQYEENRLRQIVISGTYSRGKKVGEWTYETSDFEVRFTRITGTSVQSLLDGTISRLAANYKVGIANGRWTLAVQYVKEGRKLPNSASAIINFKEGKGVGRFVFADPSAPSPLRVEGHFDEDGYFDQVWKLGYMHDKTMYQEERQYISGFLLRLTLRKAGTEEILYDVQLEDVQNKLNRAAEHGEAAVGFGDRKFGILFNDGYPEEDVRLAAQQSGNTILQRVFNYFIDSTDVFFTLPGFARPSIGNTRRFQYIYPDKEDELIEILRPITASIGHQYDSIRNTPVLRLHQEKSDTLAFYSALLDFGLDKVKIISHVLDEIESGKFDYQFRDNFYRTGVPGLHGVDTVWFEYKGRRMFRVVELTDRVVSPDSLVMNIYRYTLGMDAYISRFYDHVSPSILSLQREDRIALLDEAIVNALDTLFLTYIGDPKISYTATDEELRSKLQPNDLQLEIFKRYTRVILRMKMQEYVDTQDYESRMTRGTTILELINALVAVHPSLARIPELEAELDKVFTRYSPNPFFPRDLETRIKTGIYSRGVDVLLPYMIEELMKTSAKDELLDKVQSILKLDERLRELAAADDQDTNRLNSRIRRENQPERIRRLLGV
jgi:hypothetical protein